MTLCALQQIFARTVPLPPQPPRIVLLTLLGASTLTVMSGAIIAPALPGLLAHFAGAEGAEILVRLVLTIPALSIALFAFPAGMLVDRIGRKPVLLAGILGYAIAGGAGALLDDLTLLLISRVVLGIAVAAVMTASSTFIGDLYTGDMRFKVMGWQASFMSFGGVVFLSAGGVLAKLDWRMPFAVYLLAFLLLPTAILLLKEPARQAHVAGPDGAAPPARLNAPLIGFIMVLSFLAMAFYYMMPVQLPFLLAGLGIPDPGLAGFALAGATLTSSIAAMRFQKLRMKTSVPTVYAVALASMGIGYTGIALSSSYPMIAASTLVGGIGLGLFFPNGSSWLIGLTPPRLRGRIVGGMTASIFLGQFVSPLMTTPLSNRFGYAGGFALIAAVLLAGAVAFASWAWRARLS